MSYIFNCKFIIASIHLTLSSLASRNLRNMKCVLWVFSMRKNISLFSFPTKVESHHSLSISTGINKQSLNAKLVLHVQDLGFSLC